MSHLREGTATQLGRVLALCDLRLSLDDVSAQAQAYRDELLGEEE